MSQIMKKTLLLASLFSLSPVVLAESGQGSNTIAITMFVIFVGATLLVTRWAAKRTKTASDFYTAGGGITGFQNGLAIAGDYMSAASFLGIAGIVFVSGFDGLIYSIGWLVGWPILTFLMAERLRNLGKYTFADVVSYRFAQTPTRIFSAVSSLVVVIFYMTAQMVGSGKVIQVIFGLEYLYAELIVGSVMIAYVLFGGMTATTWVQIIKACMLLGGATIMAILVLFKFGFNPELLFAKAVEYHPSGDAIMSPGTRVTGPWSAISLGLALMLGTAGLPHILMRFFTVPNAVEARKSVAWATTWIGYFYILTFIIGFGAIVYLIPEASKYFKNGEVGSSLGASLVGGSNMAAVWLAEAVGGNLFFGFISAVAFATILAVVAGLTLAGASAVSHDLYASVIKKGNVTSAEELKVSRITTLALGVIAVLLGISFEKENVAYMVMLAFTVAASGNFPVLFMSVLWKGCTTKGAVVGGFTGLALSVLLLIVSPAIWEAVLGNDKGSALLQLPTPAIISVPAAFIVIYIVSRLDQSNRAKEERRLYVEDQEIRSETGIGSSAASNH